MATVDIVLLILLIYGGFRGSRKGFLMEVIAILALILGLIGAFKLLHSGMDFLDQHFQISGSILPYLTFFLLFILIIIGVNMLGKWIKKVLDMTLLGSFDNLAGAIIGVIKWGFLLSVVIWITAAFSLELSEKWIDGSVIYPYVEEFAPQMVEWMSGVFPFLEGLYEHVQELLRGSAQ